MIFRMMILLCWIYKEYLYKIRKFGNSEELWFYLWIGIWTGNTFLLITSSFFIVWMPTSRLLSRFIGIHIIMPLPYDSIKRDIRAQCPFAPGRS